MHALRILTKSCRLSVLVAVAVTGVAVSSCSEEQDCTDMGCTPGASITLPTPLSESGNYVFKVAFDGVELTCTATLPFQWTEPVCDQGLGLLLQGPPTGDSTSQGPADRVTGIWVDGEVDDVMVDVRINGSLVYSGSATPKYEGVEINGPGCGECFQGSAKLP